jgi:hypothetical protein
MRREKRIKLKTVIEPSDEGGYPVEDGLNYSPDSEVVEITL